MILSLSIVLVFLISNKNWMRAQTDDNIRLAESSVQIERPFYHVFWVADTKFYPPYRFLSVSYLTTLLISLEKLLISFLCSSRFFCCLVLVLQNTLLDKINGGFKDHQHQLFYTTYCYVKTQTQEPFSIEEFGCG